MSDCKNFYPIKCSEDILFCYNLLHSEIRKLEYCSKEIDKLIEVLGPSLDKLLYEDRKFITVDKKKLDINEVDYTCKCGLMKIKEDIDSAACQIDYYRDVIYSRALAHEQYDRPKVVTDERGDKFDLSERRRLAFVAGFEAAIRYCDKNKCPDYDKDEED